MFLNIIYECFLYLFMFNIVNTQFAYLLQLLMNDI